MREYRQQQDRERGTAHERGYNSRWQKYSRAYLKRNPLCACDECARLPVPMPAEVVDHIKPHRGDTNLFWDPSNHQPMAKRCHNRKTAREDGGFGR
ncbi:HNH endonuclease [Paenibacillus sp. sptzw28]|nr:HNH endonuclease [Paenibacillus sp. sptzw28]